jgi:hypothetical protein
LIKHGERLTCLQKHMSIDVDDIKLVSREPSFNLGSSLRFVAPIWGRRCPCSRAVRFASTGILAPSTRIAIAFDAKSDKHRAFCF